MPFIAAAPLAQTLDQATQYLYDVDGRLGEQAWDLQIAVEDLAKGKTVTKGKGDALIAFWRGQADLVKRLPGEMRGAIEQSLSLLGQMLAQQKDDQSGAATADPQRKQAAEAQVENRAASDPFSAQLATLSKPDLDRLADSTSASDAQAKIREVQAARDAGAGPLQDPTLTTAGQQQGQHYSAHKGQTFVDGAEMSDVRQGALGNCYLMASMASVAQRQPGRIGEMIADNRDGTFTVTLTDPESGAPVPVRVDADLPTTKAGQLAYGQSTQSGELWVSLVEKAYTQQFKGNDYNKAQGGHEWHAMKALSGNQNKSYDLSDPNQRMKAAGAMRTATQYGLPMVAASKSADPALDRLGLYPGHAYTVVAATRSSVQLRNPHADKDANGKRGNLFDLSLAEFSQAFERVCVTIDKPIEPEPEFMF